MRSRFPRLQQLHPLLVLLPLFFVVHAWLEHYQAIGFATAITMVGWYTLTSVLLFLFFFFITRHAHKALFLALLLQSINFFGSAVRETFQGRGPFSFLGKYSIILPLFLFIIILCIVLMRRNKIAYARLFKFYQLLLLIYLLLDVVMLTGRLRRSTPPPTISGTTIAATALPGNNIYLLVFDEYGSSASLQRDYGFVNDLDSFLQRKRFHIIPHSRSNYNATRLSMASMLNMEYLDFIAPGRGVTQQDYNRSIARIRNSKALLFLQQAGYTLHNYSIFDLPNSPARLEASFFAGAQRLITNRTLLGRIKKDIVPELYKVTWLQRFIGSPVTQQIAATRRTLRLLHQFIATNKQPQQFVYAHFLMPHLPFFKDANGNDRPYADITRDSEYSDTARYLAFVRYVNSEIRAIVNAIQQQDPQAVILILGDHGYRLPVPEAMPLRHFENMNAFYLPNQSYTGISDSLTLVNELGTVFNKLFKTQIPLHADSLVYIQDAQ